MQDGGDAGQRAAGVLAVEELLAATAKARADEAGREGGKKGGRPKKVQETPVEFFPQGFPEPEPAPPPEPKPAPAPKSRDKAAAAAGVNPRYVQDCKAALCPPVAPSLLRRMPMRHRTRWRP